MQKVFYDKALDDLNSAIILNPDDAAAYQNRGNIYSQRNLMHKAITDYDKAIRLNPESAESHWNRGMAWFALSRFEEAAMDLEQSFRIGRKDPYCALFLFLAHERSGQDGKKALASYASLLNADAWPAPVISLFMGKARPQEVIKATRQ